MSAKENKERIRQLYEVAGKELSEKLTAVDTAYASDCVIHTAGSEIHGREDLKEQIIAESAIYSDIQQIIDDIIAEGDKVAVRSTFRAVHTGELMGIAPTGKQVRIPVIYIHHLVDGKIQEAWTDFDALFHLTKQLGGTPSTAEDSEE